MRARRPTFFSTGLHVLNKKTKAFRLKRSAVMVCSAVRSFWCFESLTWRDGEEVSFRVMPLTDRDAGEMVWGSRGYRLVQD